MHIYTGAWDPMRLDDLAALRQLVRDAAAEAGYSEDKTFDVVLAVDEAATNVLLHGYDGTGGPLEVEIAAGGQMLAVRLRDRAPPFDPTIIESPEELPPLLERPPGGMGIFLIRKTMDAFEYRRTADGYNELTLVLYA